MFVLVLENGELSSLHIHGLVVIFGDLSQPRLCLCVNGKSIGHLVIHIPDTLNRNGVVQPMTIIIYIPRDSR